MAQSGSWTVVINISVYNFKKACLGSNASQTRMYAGAVFATLIDQNNSYFDRLKS